MAQAGKEDKKTKKFTSLFHHIKDSKAGLFFYELTWLDSMNNQSVLIDLTQAIAKGHLTLPIWLWLVQRGCQSDSEDTCKRGPAFVHDMVYSVKDPEMILVRDSAFFEVDEHQRVVGSHRSGEG